jgi:hypothetical protein
MIIIMKSNYTPQQLEAVVAASQKVHGLTPHITYGVETAIVAAVGEFHIPSLDPFEVMEGVESVKRISQPLNLARARFTPKIPSSRLTDFTSRRQMRSPSLRDRVRWSRKVRF